MFCLVILAGDPAETQVFFKYFWVGAMIIIMPLN